MENIAGSGIIFEATAVAVQKGISFPQTAISSILNGKDLIKRKRFEEIKSKVLVYLKQKKEAQISDICESLGFDLEDIVKALKELKKEGLVKEKR